MEDSSTRLILENLVRNLNLARSEDVSKITLGKYEDKTPNNNPFLRLFTGYRIDTLGIYPLEQTEYSGISGIKGYETEIRVGQIDVERRYDSYMKHEDYYLGYERIIIRINNPIELENGTAIPKSKIKISTPIGDRRESSATRVDYIRRAGIWLKKDLSDILPTEWIQ